MQNRYLTWEGVTLLVVMGIYWVWMSQNVGGLPLWRFAAAYVLFFGAPALMGVWYGLSIRRKG